MFQKDQIYNRRKDVHKVYGGQEQGGISTPANHKVIFLFTSTTGHEHGYKDGWNEEGYLYTGEGQTGDMSFTRGNKAILEHEGAKKSLHLFEYVSLGHVRYIGEMRYTSHKIVQGKDTMGNMRKMIVFTLKEVC